MHSFYAVADIGNGVELLKLYVEELYNPNSSDDINRAYQLQNIEKSSVGGKGLQTAFASPVITTDDINTISDLWKAVKQKDKHIMKFFNSEKTSKNSKGKFETSPYNPETQYAVIRSSICTGEKVAGFRDKKDGHFTEVMLIRSKKDEQEFKEKYDVENLKTEY